MNISIHELSAAVGSRFIAHTQHGLLDLTLLEAIERPRRGLPAQFQTPLSLVFSGPNHLQLSQDTYVLDHPSLGRLQWMLVPISKYGLAYAATGAAQTGQTTPQAAAHAEMAPLYEAILG
ncbi:MAG: hypothetical protein V4772_24420 [Pseudomonadota bacterium]